MDFSFSTHVQNICKSCFAQIQDLKKCLRGYLTYPVAHVVANALFGSLPPFRSFSDPEFQKLQCDQNSVDRIVTNTTKY